MAETEPGGVEIRFLAWVPDGTPEVPRRLEEPGGCVPIGPGPAAPAAVKVGVLIESPPAWFFDCGEVSFMAQKAEPAAPLIGPVALVVAESHNEADDPEQWVASTGTGLSLDDAAGLDALWLDASITDLTGEVPGASSHLRVPICGRSE